MTLISGDGVKVLRAIVDSLITSWMYWFGSTRARTECANLGLGLSSRKRRACLCSPRRIWFSTVNHRTGSRADNLMRRTEVGSAQCSRRDRGRMMRRRVENVAGIGQER